MQPLKKIVAIGPECTGKSTLCAHLAHHFETLWCPEFARDYLLSNGISYTYEDLLTIAKGQLALEDECVSLMVTRQPPITIPRHSPLSARHSSLLFIDTNMYVMKVWCEYVFGKCHQFILDEIASGKYDLYLLCNIDLPWVKDELREYPDEQARKELYNIYKDILISQQTPWVEITGSNEERLQNAIDAIENFL